MTEFVRRGRATGADVARLAGVSEATVSYVLNDKPTASVAESTRQRVRAAAADLGYRPNPTARSLRVGRSDVVIALMPDLDYSIAYQRSLQELTWALTPHGLSLVVHPTPVDSAGMRELWRAFTPVCVFAFVSLRPEDVQAIHAAGIQVAVSCSSHPGRRPWELKFGGDDVGRAQAEHLLATGHTNLGLALPVAPAATAISAGRRAGLAAAVQPVDEGSLSVRHIPWEPEAARRELQRWLKEEPGMTAVAAWNDDMAALIASSASRAGLVVPDDLAVIGAYDFPIATLVHPALSTVQVDLATRMQTIATAIVTGLEGHPLPTTMVGNEQTTVVRRAST